MPPLLFTEEQSNIHLTLLSMNLQIRRHLIKKIHAFLPIGIVLDVAPIRIEDNILRVLQVVFRPHGKSAAVTATRIWVVIVHEGDVCPSNVLAERLVVLVLGHGAQFPSHVLEAESHILEVPDTAIPSLTILSWGESSQ